MTITSRIKVGILYGGKSAEHEVSVESARNIFDAIDKNNYDPLLILIDKQGEWLTDLPLILSMDVIFPVLHGPFGEDGTMQGLLTLADKPFVGAGVLGSAVGMDKEAMKRLLREAGLPIGNFITLTAGQTIPSLAEIKRTIGLPCFIKPANSGSSIGIHKVKDEADYLPAIQDAFQYDRKILIEEFIAGREIECAVLGDNEPRTSVAGEIIAKQDFYSYEAKYLDDDGADLIVPAPINATTLADIQDLAVKTFQALYCSGLARVDFFLQANGDIIINEINTMPGFTKISMYPKLWSASGIGYAELIDRLIKLALENYATKKYPS